MGDFRDQMTDRYYEILDIYRRSIGKSFCGREFSVIISRAIMAVHLIAQKEALGANLGKITNEIYTEFPNLVREVVQYHRFETLLNILLLDPDIYLDWNKIVTLQFVTQIHYNTLLTYYSPEKRMINPALRNALRDIFQDGSLMAILSLVIDELEYIYQEDGVNEVESARRSFRLHRNRSRNTETNTPVEDQTNTPVEDQTNTPVEDQTNTPVKDQTNTPVKDQTNTPVKDQTNTPVEGTE